jgi:hypothetical protein
MITGSKIKYSYVTSEKPRAVAYIDDKALRFVNWEDCMVKIKNIFGLK